jgi:hypothetical protein
VHYQRILPAVAKGLHLALAQIDGFDFGYFHAVRLRASTNDAI